MRYYPVFVDLAGQPCVVLGADKLALDKVEGLLEAGARVTVIASLVDGGLEELAVAGRIILVRRAYRPGDLAGARLVIDTSEDEVTNQGSWAEAEAAGTLINVVDQPERCRFIAPSVVRRDPLLVAISTSAESPFLAAALRSRLERLLGSEWGPFVGLVGRIRRRLRERRVSLNDQAPVYRRLLTSGIRRLLRQGRVEEAEREAAAIASATPIRPGRVALVGAGPGGRGLLTVAAQDMLAEAEYVFYDALVGADVLALCGPQAELIDVGKRGGRENPEQERINARMVELAQAGHDIVRLKGGDPFVFGRGGEEMADLIQARIEVIVVPGVSAAVAAPGVAGIPLTMRGIAISVALISGALRETGAAPDNLEDLARTVDTLVILMPMGNLTELAGRLAAVLGPDHPAALIAKATTPDQEIWRSTLGQLRDIPATSPATLVVGKVVNAVPVQDPTATLTTILS